MKFTLILLLGFFSLLGCKEDTTSKTPVIQELTDGSKEEMQEPTNKTNMDTMTNKTDEKQYYIKISTNYGDMVAKLYNETPQHRDNILKLAKEGYFDDLLFHRVIPQFMIQGGDPDSRNAPAGKQLGSGGPAYTIPAEFNSNFIHKKGALSAARQGDQVNPKKASSGSQFYIVQGKTYTDEELKNLEMQTRSTITPEHKKIYKEIGGTPFLDNNYTVFGEVISGLDVIDKIAAVKTMPGDRPEKDVKMKITIVDHE